MIRQQILCIGDSYILDAEGIGIATSLAKLLPRSDVICRGVPASTLAQIEARAIADIAEYPHAALVLCDGNPNAHDVDIRVDMARYAAIRGMLGHDAYVIVPPLPRSSQDEANRQRSRDLTAALLAADPGHVVDMLPALLAMGDPLADAADIAARVCPISLLAPPRWVHLVGPAMDAVVAADLLPALSRSTAPK